MNKFPKIFFVCVFFFVTLYSKAEPGGCVPGPCPKEDHLEYGRGAGTIFVATFSFSKYEKNFHRDDSSIDVDVNVVQVLRQTDPIASKITFSIDDAKVFGAVKKDCKDDIHKEFVKIISEKNVNFIRKEYETYENKFSPESANKLKSSVNFAVIKVSPGPLDTLVKDAFTPVFEGEKYVVFFSNDYLVDGHRVWSRELDIYPYEIYNTIYKDKPILINK